MQLVFRWGSRMQNLLRIPSAIPCRVSLGFYEIIFSLVLHSHDLFYRSVSEESEDIMLRIPPNNNLFILIPFLDKPSGEYLRSYPTLRNFPFLSLPNTRVFSADSLFRIFLSEFLVETSTQMNRWLLPDAQSLPWPSGTSGKLSAPQAD
jgi:hypothetical protein